MRPLTFGSLFAGIGGMDLGLERAGMRCAWQVEINPYARRVLAKHWPDVPRFNDVRDVHGEHVGDCLSPVDLICGGFPCQDISNAGKRVGIEGEQSGLWAEFARIIREVRPRYVLVENVAALLARGLGRVLGDLAQSGFDAEWDCIPAAAVGAPHRRDRLFLVAHSHSHALRLESERHQRKGRRVRAAERGNAVALVDGQVGDVADAAVARVRRLPDEGRAPVRHADGRGEALAHAKGLGRSPGLFGRTAHAPEPNSWWSAEPDVGRVAHGVPARVDRLRGLGNAVVPQVAEYVGRLIVAHAEQSNPQPKECNGSQG